jgi:hypothetical protein
MERRVENITVSFRLPRKVARLRTALWMSFASYGSVKRDVAPTAAHIISLHSVIIRFMYNASLLTSLLRSLLIRQNTWPRHADPTSLLVSFSLPLTASFILMTFNIGSCLTRREGHANHIG